MTSKSIGKNPVQNQKWAEREIKRIVHFIGNYVKKSGALGVVLGISGGIDSAVVAFLSVKALGREKVLGVFLFEDDFENSSDYRDARKVSSKIGIKTIKLPVSSVLRALAESLEKEIPKHSRIVYANLKARTRMILLYAIANQKNLLVAGTGDRSEIELGYFTKYGDGGVDFLPIGHLYKTEVQEVAKHLAVPTKIITKPSSPHLWKHHKASEELPAEYPILDAILRKINSGQKNSEQIAKELGISSNVVGEVFARRAANKHKTKMPPTLLSSRRGG